MVVMMMMMMMMLMMLVADARSGGSSNWRAALVAREGHRGLFDYGATQLFQEVLLIFRATATTSTTT